VARLLECTTDRTLRANDPVGRGAVGALHVGAQRGDRRVRELLEAIDGVLDSIAQAVAERQSGRVRGRCRRGGESGDPAKSRRSCAWSISYRHHATRHE
jgi:hypothetical protein